MASVCLVLSLTTVTGSHAPKSPICQGDLIFEDNFNKFDLKVWKHESTLGGGSSNNQFQIYGNNRSNTYVQDGVLHLATTLTADEFGAPFLNSGTLDINSWLPHAACTNLQYEGCKRIGNPTNIINPVKNARINTADSFSFTYGKVEVRAKVPAGDWIWPAIWMVPRYLQYSSWPASGEIDIMESRANRQYTSGGVNIGAQQVVSTLHWGPNPNYNKWRLSSFTKNNASGWNTDFHKYQLLWTPDNITFMMDDVVTGTVTPPDGGFWEFGQFNNSRLNNPWKGASKMAPFDSHFFLILNVAIGGTSFFSDSAINTPYAKPWSNSDGRASLAKFWNARANWLPTWNLATDSSHLQVDYVRIWAL